MPMEVDRHEPLTTSGSRSMGANHSPPWDQTRQVEQSEELIYSQAGGDATSRQPSNVSWGDQMSAEEGASTAAGSDEWQTAHSKSSKRRRDHSSDHHQQHRLWKEAQVSTTLSPKESLRRKGWHKFSSYMKLWDSWNVQAAGG